MPDDRLEGWKEQVENADEALTKASISISQFLVSEGGLVPDFVVAALRGLTVPLLKENKDPAYRINPDGTTTWLPESQSGQYTYVVANSDIVVALSKVDPAAAEWWTENRKNKSSMFRNSDVDSLVD